jgi:DNA-binding transcriptional LysR family regulator
LEAQVGLVLLMRDASGASPTAAGEVLALQGRELVAQAQAVVTAARDRGDPPEGRLRLVLPVGLPPHLLAALFGMARAR